MINKINSKIIIGILCICIFSIILKKIFVLNAPITSGNGSIVNIAQVVKNYHRYGFINLRGAPINDGGQIDINTVSIWSSYTPFLYSINYIFSQLFSEDENNMNIISQRIPSLLFHIINLFLLFFIFSTTRLLSEFWHPEH